MTIRPQPTAELYPLSSVQHRLWFIDQLEPGHRAYNNCRAVRIRGHLQPQALAAALSMIVRRHQPLRTRYESVEGLPMQRVDPPQPVPLPLTPVSEIDAPRAVATEIARPIRLAVDQPLRARLLEIGPQDHILVLTVHHIAIDSMAPLFRELGILYDAYCRGVEPSLPELSIQYSDYVAWEKSQLNEGPRLERLEEYWGQQLAAAPAVRPVPLDMLRPAMLSPHGARHYFSLSAVPLEAFRDLIKAQKTTAYVTLLGAFGVLLMHYSGGENVLVSTPAACRELPELQPMIGCFANTLALILNLSGGASFREVVQRTGKAVWGGIAHQRLPFNQAIGAAGSRRSMRTPARVQVNFRVAKADTLSLGTLETEFLPIHNGGAKFDLAAEFTPELEGFLEYSTDVFLPQTILTLAASFENLLGLLVANPDAPVNGPEFQSVCARRVAPPALKNFRRSEGVTLSRGV